MKKLFLIALLSIGLTGSLSMASNVSQDETVSEVQDQNDGISKGDVNLCDPDGTICEIGHLYYSPSAERYYVKVHNGGSICWVQPSNKSGWRYMIRLRDTWYYFSF